MLKHLKCFVVAIAATMVLILSGCENSSDGINPAILLALGNTGVSSTVTIDTHASGDIVKNKVVGLDAYEYFEFTSTEGGKYYFYQNDAQVTTYNGEALPTSFTYDSSTGKYTVGNSSSFVFSAKKSGTLVSAIASELMTTSDNDVSFESTWTCSSGTFVFDSDKASVSYNNISYGYSISSGWVEVADTIPLYWDSVSKFYFTVYETTSESVEEVGRSGEATILYTSPVFIYKALNK